MTMDLEAMYQRVDDLLYSIRRVADDAQGMFSARYEEDGNSMMDNIEDLAIEAGSILEDLMSEVDEIKKELAKYEQSQAV
jgi:hypothetical protein